MPTDKRVVYFEKVSGQPLKMEPGSRQEYAEYDRDAAPGRHKATFQRAYKEKSDNQVKMIFGLMIQSTIEQAEYLGIGVEDLLKYLIDGNIPKGVGLNKDFLHALMYVISPTVDEDGKLITLSKMNTKQAADLFERYRNLLAPLGIVIPDPDPNWREK
jgi:hypothetical protein